MAKIVSCKSCGRGWEWTPADAAQRIICTCGQNLQFAASVPAEALDETDQLSLESLENLEPVQTDRSAPFAVAASSALSNSPAIVPEAIPVTRRTLSLAKTSVLPYRTVLPSADGKPWNRQKGFLLGSPRRDFYLPLIFLFVGCGMSVGRMIHAFDSLALSVTASAAQMLVSVVITLLVVAAFHKMMDMDLGSTAGTLLKLGAIAIFPNALAGLMLLGRGGYCPEVGAAGVFIFVSVLMYMGLFSIGIAEAFPCVLAVCLLNIFAWALSGRLLNFLFTMLFSK